MADGEPGYDIPVVTLLTATVPHLEALRDNRSAFGALIGGEVPDGWPEFNDMVEFTLRRLIEHPREADWWTQFFFDVDGALVGSGGFVGPPTDRTVEIGYEIAPAYRGQRLGVGAANALVGAALASGKVDSVVAHTLAQPSPSTRVLRRLDFVHTEDVFHPEDGKLWRWKLSHPSTSR